MTSSSMLEGAIDCGIFSQSIPITSPIPEIVPKASSSKLIWYVIGALILISIVYLIWKTHSSDLDGGITLPVDPETQD